MAVMPPQSAVCVGQRSRAQAPGVKATLMDASPAVAVPIVGALGATGALPSTLHFGDGSWKPSLVCGDVDTDTVVATSAKVTVRLTGCCLTPACVTQAAPSQVCTRKGGIAALVKSRSRWAQKGLA